MDFDKSKISFRNASGAHLLKPIFFELDDTDRKYAVYTLKDRDHEFDGKLYYSLRRLYVACGDPTEYSFAETYLDGWSHWKKLAGASFFQEYLAEWREELEINLRSRQLLNIVKTASSGAKESYQAQKFIATAGWKTSDESKEKVGRPSKEKILKEAERLFEQKNEFDEDYTRIMGGLN